jgi:NAD(P)H dehydrogenase (quinone)
MCRGKNKGPSSKGQRPPGGQPGIRAAARINAFLQDSLAYLVGCNCICATYLWSTHVIEEVPMTTIAIVYHSGYGHTAVLAQAAAEGVTRAGGTPVLLKIESGEQDFAPLLDAAAKADGILFGAPTYMGSVSAQMKAFMDASSKSWYVQAWKDKAAAGFTNSASLSGDKLNSLIQLAIFASQHAMIWVSTGQMSGNANGNSDAAAQAPNRLGSFLGAMAQSDNAGSDVTPPEGDKETVRLLAARVTKVAAKLAA